MGTVRNAFAPNDLPPSAACPGARRRQRRRRHARAFTMIEILVVIGVIIVLAAIVLVGMRSITGRTQEQQTRVAMQNLRNMVAEYNARTKLKAPREWLWWQLDQNATVVSIATSNPDNLDFWRVPARGGSPPRALPMPTIRNVQQNGADRQKKAVVNTAIAVLLLTQLPENRNALQSFQDRLMVLPNDIDQPTPSYDESQARVPLDAWGNPIILVPGSGLWGVEVAGQMIAETNPIKSGDSQPFWASAGPDGDFSKGDDNIYSFDE